VIHVYAGFNALNTPRTCAPGDGLNQPFQLAFNAYLELDFLGSRVRGDEKQFASPGKLLGVY
jgi:hypothetical protein